MRSLFLIAALAAAYVSSTAVGLKHQCGTSISAEAIIAAERTFVRPGVKSTHKAQLPTIQIVWHVISENSTAQGGNIPDSLIQRQIEVLIQDYARVGITWGSLQIDRWVNSSWAVGIEYGSAQESDMKRALHQGGALVLNVYSVVQIGGAPPGYSIDGFSTFPWDYQANQWKDGIILATYALPGGPYSSRNLGRTLAHEVGHWAGLYHTFQGSCNYPGDFVDDTPYEASAASGCPTGRDTCSYPGLDPIHNYMDYTDDACRTGLTPGQIGRLTEALRQFRENAT